MQDTSTNGKHSDAKYHETSLLTCTIRRLRPILYRVVKIGVPKPGISPSSVTFDEIGVFVHHLLLTIPDGKEFIRIVKLCPNLEDLSLWDGSREFIPALLDVLDHQPVMKLSVDLSLLDSNSVSRPAFSRITHFDVLALSGRSWARWSPIASLPHLTHLCINGLVDFDVISNLLEKCTLLQVLFLSIISPLVHPNSPGDPIVRITALQDARLVLMEGYSWREANIDWKMGARGGFDLWTFGRMVCEARSRESNIYH